MNQQHLMELLVEAATCTDWRRVNAIQVELEHATHGGDADVIEIDDRQAGIRVVLGTLFVQTYQSNPAILPQLFPAFAVMCGIDGDKYIVAHIDWSVYRDNHKTAPAIHTFECSTWGWVKLTELAEIVGMKPSEVLRQYGELNTAYPNMAICNARAVTDPTMSSLIQSVQHDEEISLATLGTLYVPAGWSKVVLAAHRAEK